MVLQILEKGLDAHSQHHNVVLQSYLQTARENLLQNMDKALKTRESIAQTAHLDKEISVVEESELFKKKLPMTKSKPKCIPMEQSVVEEEEKAAHTTFQNGRQEFVKWLKTLNILETLRKQEDHLQEHEQSLKLSNVKSKCQHVDFKKHLHIHTANVLTEICHFVDFALNGTGALHSKSAQQCLERLELEVRSVLEIAKNDIEEQGQEKDFVLKDHKQQTKPEHQSSIKKEASKVHEVMHYQEKRILGKKPNVSKDSSLYLETSTTQVMAIYAVLFVILYIQTHFYFLSI